MIYSRLLDFFLTENVWKNEADAAYVMVLAGNFKTGGATCSITFLLLHLH